MFSHKDEEYRITLTPKGNKALEDLARRIEKQMQEEAAKDLWKCVLDNDIDEYIVKSEESVDYKTDQGKARLDLVPPILIESVGEVMTYGNTKYPEGSWKKVASYRYRAALIRHLMNYLKDNKSKDDESGLHHLKHIACNVAFLLELEGVE